MTAQAPKRRIHSDADTLSALVSELQNMAARRGTNLLVGAEHENIIMPQGILNIYTPRQLRMHYVLTFYGPLLTGEPPLFDMGGFFLSGYNADIGAYKTPEVDLATFCDADGYHAAILEIKREQKARIGERLREDPARALDAALSELSLIAQTAFNRSRLSTELHHLRDLRDDLLDGVTTPEGIRAAINGDLHKGTHLHQAMLELILDPHEHMRGKDFLGREVDLTPVGRGVYEADSPENMLLILVPYHQRVMDAKLGDPKHPKLYEAFLSGDEAQCQQFIDDFLSEENISAARMAGRRALLHGESAKEQVENLFTEFLTAKMRDRYTVADMLMHRAEAVHRSDLAEGTRNARDVIEGFLGHAETPDFMASPLYGNRRPEDLIRLYAEQANKLIEILNLEIAPLPETAAAEDAHRHHLDLVRALRRSYPNDVRWEVYVEVMNEVVDPIRDILWDNLNQWTSVDCAHWERLQRKPALLGMADGNVQDHPLRHDSALSLIDRAISGLAPADQRAVWHAVDDVITYFREQRHYLYGGSADKAKNLKLDTLEALLGDLGLDPETEVARGTSLREALRVYVVQNCYGNTDLYCFRMQEEMEKAYNIIKPLYEELYRGDPNTAAALRILKDHVVDNVQPEGSGREGGENEMVLEILSPELARVFSLVKQRIVTGDTSTPIVIYGLGGEQVTPDLGGLANLSEEFPDVSANLYTSPQTYAASIHNHLDPLLLDENGEYTINSFCSPSEEVSGRSVMMKNDDGEMVSRHFITEFGFYFGLALGKFGTHMRAAMGNNYDDIIRNSEGLAAGKFFELLNVELDNPARYALERMGSAFRYAQPTDKPKNGRIEDRAPGASSDAALHNIYHELALHHAMDNYVLTQLERWSGEAINADNLRSIALDYAEAQPDPQDPVMWNFLRHSFEETLARMENHLEQGLLIPGEFDAIMATHRARTDDLRADGGGPRKVWWFDVTPVLHQFRAESGQIAWSDVWELSGERGAPIVPPEELEIFKRAFRDPNAGDPTDRNLQSAALVEAVNATVQRRLDDFADCVNRFMAYRHELTRDLPDLVLRASAVEGAATSRQAAAG